MVKAKKKKRFEHFAHNWSWWDTLIGFLGGSFCGVIATMLSLDSHWEAVTLLKEFATEIIEIFLIAFLLGRMIAVARWPRKIPLDYNKITMPGVIAAHFITIVMGIMAVIITLALVAPGVLELLAKHQ